MQTITAVIGEIVTEKGIAMISGVALTQVITVGAVSLLVLSIVVLLTFMIIRFAFPPIAQVEVTTRKKDSNLQG